MPRQRNRPPNDFDPSEYQPFLNAFLRLNPQARLAVVAFLVVVAIIAAVAYIQSQRHQANLSTTPAAAASTADMLLGNPSSATTDAANRDNYLMVKKYFSLSYNSSSGIPNWVSWQITRDHLGGAPRKLTFDPDVELPAGFNRVTTNDYKSTGFDRGHMCPHGDRAASQEMSFATFVMTNVIPQAPNVNRKAWEQLESYCRDLVAQRQHLYVIAGPDAQGGRGERGYMDTLPTGRVLVPAECWKIIIVVPEAGDDELAKINPNTRVISVIMPNDNDIVGEEWAKFRTTPAAIEARTHFKFFNNLPPDLAQTLRQKVDFVTIPPPRPRNYGGE